MCALNSVLGLYGVEVIRDEDAYVDAYHGDIVGSYLNSGDQYAATIILDHRDGTMHIGNIRAFGKALERERDDG